MYFWEIPPYHHQQIEWNFREKVQEQIGQGNSVMENTAAHAILAYVDVLRQRVNILEEALDDLVMREETALREMVRDEISRIIAEEAASHD